MTKTISAVLDLERWKSRAASRAWLTAYAVCALLLVHGVLAFTGALEKSPTFDESIHLVSGYTYWLHNDYRLQPENGNLPQRIAALPLLVLDPEVVGTDDPLWKQARQWDLAFHTLYLTENQPDRLFFWGRLMIVFVSMGLGLLVFFWSRSLFGAGGGLVSLALFAFSPTMLAHGSLVTSDMTAAFFFLAATGFLWRLFHKTDAPGLVLAGLAVGGLLLSKMSAVLIAPMAVLVYLFCVFSKNPLEIGIIRKKTIIASRFRKAWVLALVALVAAAVSLAVVWGAYGFRYQAFSGPAGRFQTSFEKELEKAGALSQPIQFMRDNRLLPEAYLYGFTFVLSHSQARRAFLMGQYSYTGWWYFFPFAFAVKTPLAVLAFFLAGLIALAVRRRPETLRRFVPLVILFGVYWAFALASNLNIGHRHLLPVYPVLFILAGAAVLFWRLHRLARFAIGAGLGLLLFQSLMVWPDYLAFFNPVSGGPRNAYRLLVDSSLDWGQDLTSLSTWLEKRNLRDQDTIPVYLAYFGTASPGHYGMRPYILPHYGTAHMDPKARPEPLKLTGGFYCISASLLQQVGTATFGHWSKSYEEAYQTNRRFFLNWVQNLKDPEALERFYAGMGGKDKALDVIRSYQDLRFGRLCLHLRNREPDGRAGYSILIYEVSFKELEDALNGPPAVLY
ncbi:MAG: glycosyltransferase family 39 protein, partial [Deltaproteobacteria bacterium]|nr:glycosyltransferase family 39 protein [Deltaproteobacteria bacterium]